MNQIDDTVIHDVLADFMKKTGFPDADVANAVSLLNESKDFTEEEINACRALVQPLLLNSTSSEDFVLSLASIAGSKTKLVGLIGSLHPDLDDFQRVLLVFSSNSPAFWSTVALEFGPLIHTKPLSPAVRERMHTLAQTSPFLKFVALAMFSGLFDALAKL